MLQLANEVAYAYSDNLYGNPFGNNLPVHNLLLPNGNLEDTMNFIKWNMEERHGDSWGCFVMRGWRRYRAYQSTEFLLGGEHFLVIWSPPLAYGYRARARASRV